MNIIVNADSIQYLKTLPENSIDAIITDPPYELNIGNNSWDKSGIAFNTELWTLCLKVLKHGGHLLSFAASKNVHKITTAIEDSGFEIRDQIVWLHGQGFPKGYDVGERLKLKGYPEPETYNEWNTAIKPSHEPIIVARKPLSEQTLYDNVYFWGVGAYNLNNTRIGTETTHNINKKGDFYNKQLFNNSETIPTYLSYPDRKPKARHATNVILDETIANNLEQSKFFYVPKPSRFERIKADGVTHPTQKPVKLMEYLIQLVTPENATILDPFAGSGTTIEAAINTNRKYIGIELTEIYLPLIEKRIKRATEKKNEQQN